jgi:hypothetical protein
MGGASAGVWWGEPGVWGNPATLAGVEGIGWLDGRTRLVPGLAPDVWLKSQRLLLGGAGVGVSLMGDPIKGLGRTRLDYGADGGTDPFGNPTGTFHAYEQIDAWGLGVSPLLLYDALQHARRGGDLPPPRPIDFALGLQHKHTVVALAPASQLGNAEADCIDWGASARASLLPGNDLGTRIHLDVSAGFAMLNANDANFGFTGTGESAPPSRIRRIGFALHAALPSPWSLEGGMPPIWLLAGEPHAIEVGLAEDTEHINAGGHGPSFNVQRFGVEVTAFGVLTGRIGHVTDRIGEIVDNTYGFGVRLPIGPWASVAYDRASVPQANDSGLPRVTRQGWSAWIDPAHMWADRRAAHRSAQASASHDGGRVAAFSPR